MELINEVEILDVELKYVPETICKTLIFDVVQPEAISGKMGLYQGEFTITMDNEDFMVVYYDHPFMGEDKEVKQQISINSRAFVEMGNEEPLEDLIREHYKRHLKQIVKR